MTTTNLRVTVVLLMISALAIAGCQGIKKKQVDPLATSGEEITAEPETEKEKTSELPVEVLEPAPEKEELSPAERAIIEEEELDRQRRLAEEEAALNLENFRPQDIFFDLDRSDLSMSGREMLSKIADWMEYKPSVRLIIEGHADERGTSEYNLSLGERRAEAARRYLFNLGVDDKRLSTISYGEEMPLGDDHSESSWAKNRRIHFEVR